MIESTETGFKVVLGNVNSIEEIGNFIHDLREEGFWYATTRETFGQSCLDALHAIIDYSDALVIVTMVLALFSLGGSKTAKKYTYWSVFTFIIIKMLGVYI